MKPLFISFLRPFHHFLITEQNTEQKRNKWGTERNQKVTTTSFLSYFSLSSSINKKNSFYFYFLFSSFIFLKSYYVFECYIFVVRKNWQMFNFFIMYWVWKKKFLKRCWAYEFTLVLSFEIFFNLSTMNWAPYKETRRARN